MAAVKWFSTTGPQFKVGYNTTNRVDFTVSSGGDLTIAPTGGDVNITGNLAISGTFSTASLSLSSTLSVAGRTSLAAIARITGLGTPATTGAGLEMYCATGDAFIRAYNRDTGTRGGATYLGYNGSGDPGIGVSSGGVALVGTTAVGSATQGGIRTTGTNQFDGIVRLDGTQEERVRSARGATIQSMRQVEAVSVSTTATTIATLSNAERGGRAIVTGSAGSSGTRFRDEVAWLRDSGSVDVISSLGGSTAAARTYTSASGSQALQAAMASGTYNLRVTFFEEATG